MNQEVGSIMKYFYSIFPCTVYSEEVPENFKVPSLYYPPAHSFDENDSNNAYKKLSTLSVKLFHKSNHAAIKEAEEIAYAVRSNRMLIPVFNYDGTPINDYIRITRIETRMGEGFAIINVNWTSRHYYERELWTSVEEIINNTSLKE